MASDFDVLADQRQASAESRQYYHDPVGFLERYIDWPAGSSLADYQEGILGKVVEKRRVAVRGPHGLGKSTTAALLIIWFALTREIAGVDWKVPTTATAWRHLTLYLWPEIHKWLRRVKWDELGLPEPQKRTELLDMRLKLTHGAASAIASDDPVTLEGAHADSILFVYDESKAIPNATWDATEGALSGVGDGEDEPDEGQSLEAYALAISTPGAPAGRFYDIHARKPGLEDWHPIHVTLEDAIRAKRISRKWAEQRKLLWGEESAIYRNRVLGEFHSADEDAVVPLGWVEQANDRYEEWQRNGSPQEGKKIVSTDVARTGSDFTVITDRYDRVLAKIHKHRFADTMRTATEVIKHLDDTATAIVDSVGIGAGVLDRLRELKLKVRAYTGSKKTHHMDRTKEFGFTNTRSAAYWNLRELLDPAFGAEIALPPDDSLTGDLTSPKYTYTTGVPPKIKVEPKEDLAARIGRSPDVGDAVVMSFWLDREHGESTVVVPGSQWPERSDVTPDPPGDDEDSDDKEGTDPQERNAPPAPPVTRTGNVNRHKSKRITRISPLDTVRNPVSRIGR